MKTIGHLDSEKDTLLMKERQGKICPNDTTGRVSSYLGSHQQWVIDVTDQLPAPFHPKAKTTSWEESISIEKVLQLSNIREGR